MKIHKKTTELFKCKLFHYGIDTHDLSTNVYILSHEQNTTNISIITRQVYSAVGTIHVHVS